MRWSYFPISTKVRRILTSRILLSSFYATDSSLGDVSRALEPIPIDQIRKRVENFEAPADSRISKTVLIGCPNAGKSVLTNALVDAPVSAVSSKVHTTRRTVRGACMLDDRTQLLILDTPGVVTSTRAKKHNLEDTLLTDPDGAMLGADTACVLLDAADRHTRLRLDPRILHLLYRHRERLTSVLVVTKIDVVKDRAMLLNLATKLTKGIVGGAPLPFKQVKSMLLEETEQERLEKLRLQRSDEEDQPEEADRTTKNGDSDAQKNETSLVDKMLEKHWTGVNWNMLKKIATVPWPQVQESMLLKCYRDEVGWPLFDRIFMVSALHGDGIEELRDYLNERSRIGKWRFHPTVLTDQDPQEMVKDIVRASLMDRLRFHIPYTLDFKICVWEVNENDVLCIRLDVLCPQERDGKFIIGPKGETITAVAAEITQTLRNLFQREVYFRLGVVTARKKKW